MAETRLAAGDTAAEPAERTDVGRRAQQAARDLADTAQRQPVQALAAAVAVGFLAGRISKRRRRR
jgi:ElaB/YqjD/DUF883 family membrane-anchored ribosome-binding protein